MKYHNTKDEVMVAFRKAKERKAEREAWIDAQLAQIAANIGALRVNVG